ncbi:cobalamin-dependent protein [Mycoplasmatota bacterium]|nr:cobalamin-dependent protein [Mycoplasmatota bacterium]
MKVDLKKVKPYGDTLDDGKVQVSFTLPLPADEKAYEAALLVAKGMNLENPSIAHQEELDKNFSYYVVYGNYKNSVNYDDIKIEAVDTDKMDMYGVQKFIEKNIKRNVVIIGAATGTDAHTVGIDAIMNMKGFAGHYGLERYIGIDALNMGSQVPNEELIKKAIEVKADAILVSQVVTQKGIHVDNLTNLIELLEAEGIRDKVIVVAGGPRITHELAKELGYDAGFGSKKYADDVASFIVQEMINRKLV